MTPLDIYDWEEVHYELSWVTDDEPGKPQAFLRSLYPSLKYLVLTQATAEVYHNSFSSKVVPKEAEFLAVLTNTIIKIRESLTEAFAEGGKHSYDGGIWREIVAKTWAVSPTKQFPWVEGRIGLSKSQLSIQFAITPSDKKTATDYLHDRLQAVHHLQFPDEKIPMAMGSSWGHVRFAAEYLLENKHQIHDFNKIATEFNEDFGPTYKLPTTLSKGLAETIRYLNDPLLPPITITMSGRKEKEILDGVVDRLTDLVNAAADPEEREGWKTWRGVTQSLTGPFDPEKTEDNWWSAIGPGITGLNALALKKEEEAVTTRLSGLVLKEEEEEEE